MPLRPPTKDDLRSFGDSLFLNLTDEELEFFAEMAEQRAEAYETVRSYDPESRLGGRERRKRTAGVRLPDEENPHNAWVSQCYVAGDDGGDLDGLAVAIKDNVCVSGVELTCGSQVVEGYVPDVDATIVSRLLEAGAAIKEPLSSIADAWI